ncbi:MAG: hypothetical protein AAF533_25900 [Acidobacteriota bacterium]
MSSQFSLPERSYPRIANPVVVAGLLLCVVFGIYWFKGPDRVVREPEPPLTQELLSTYLDIAWDFRIERRRARLAGWHPATWHEWPELSATLKRVGWTMPDYMRIEGQVATARLRLQYPELFERDDYRDSDAPQEHLDLVEPVLARVLEVHGDLPEIEAPNVPPPTTQPAAGL